MPRVQLPDGTNVDAPADATARTVAAGIGEGLARAALGARVAGELVDADRPLAEAAPAGAEEPLELGIVTAPRSDKKGRSKWRDDAHEKDALFLLRHSAAHVMAEAILRLHPDAELAYGPPLETGFYYDLALETPISSDDFEKIEASMREIAEEDRPFTRIGLPVADGRIKLEAEGNKYKLDNADRAADQGANVLSWYITGEAGSGAFEDLCQGPHVDRTGRLGAFKITAVSQSHWHGDTNSDRFQRVYGTAFFTEADLADHLEKLEEAKQRDHRVIGKRLGLFAIDEEVGGGLVLWKPDGAVIRQELQTFIGEHLARQGYSQVFTPHIGKLGLYRTSGHFPYYADSQFPPLIDRETIGKLADEGCSCADLSAKLSAGDVDGYLLKPMNCPHHIRIYADGKHSHRDLPIRLAEFGTVYRWEQSGELGGMTRVRGFTQDDAHLFVTPEQLGAEVRGCIDLVKAVFETLGMADYRVRVGLRDPDSSKFVGDPEDWDLAERACREAASSLGVAFSEEPGEAAFYGPKIDFVVRDVIGREWQLGTVQVDYQLPQRFGLRYTGADNAEHVPVMIHRAPFGSMERFVGCLIEHFGGRFPLWLAPHQVRVLPVSEKFDGYAGQICEELKAAGLRASVDSRSGRVGAKIASAQAQEVPYMLVVGGKDEAAGTVSVRTLTADLGAVPRASFLARVIRERDERALPA
ncbi:threonine--tRNA ligase [Phycisphaera mikurensis]|uniref:Threonine--tRNA ligase n=1 Tax=Phycisphaera mikurensis (strain NBRC 102666 / KCTC 22515 / FYK2301M01) TaxID=1142394 RepID=I0IHH7_PHYMF|nr:threonine--tRNA ligase [Phycisphaera mikurensis]MBB6440962.1 threonyl-tRNA synthetase [Phycisphaera mikurensis]BAM04715.1 threonyl-tRNA synthetase [Phycisphaera mikurensis NBRC 102666]